MLIGFKFNFIILNSSLSKFSFNFHNWLNHFYISALKLSTDLKGIFVNQDHWFVYRFLLYL